MLNTQNTNLLEKFLNVSVDSNHDFLQKYFVVRDFIIAKSLNAKFTKVINRFEPEMVEYIKGLYDGEWETYELVLNYMDLGRDIVKHLMIYLIDNSKNSCKIIIEDRYLTKRDNKLVYDLFDRTFDNSGLLELKGSFEANILNFEIINKCNIEELEDIEKLEDIEDASILELGDMKEYSLYRENSEYKRNVLYLDSRFVSKEDGEVDDIDNELVRSTHYQTYKHHRLFNNSYNNITKLNTDLIWLMANDDYRTVKMLNHRQANGYGFVLEFDPYFIQRTKQLDSVLFEKELFNGDFEITPICIKQLGLYSDWYGIWKCSVEGDEVEIKEPICVFHYKRFSWYSDSLRNGLARSLFLYNKEPKKEEGEYYSANEDYYPFEQLMEEDHYPDIDHFLVILSQYLQNLRPFNQYPFPSDLKAKTFSIKNFI